MIVIVAVKLLILYHFQIDIIHATTTCHFSRPSNVSPTGWIDLVDECPVESNGTICFSGVSVTFGNFNKQTSNLKYNKKWKKKKLKYLYVHMKK